MSKLTQEQNDLISRKSTLQILLSYAYQQHSKDGLEKLERRMENMLQDIKTKLEVSYDKA